MGQVESRFLSHEIAMTTTGSLFLGQLAATTRCGIWTDNFPAWSRGVSPDISIQPTWGSFRGAWFFHPFFALGMHARSARKLQGDTHTNPFLCISLPFLTCFMASHMASCAPRRTL